MAYTISVEKVTTGKWTSQFCGLCSRQIRRFCFVFCGLFACLLMTHRLFNFSSVAHQPSTSNQSDANIQPQLSFKGIGRAFSANWLPYLRLLRLDDDSIEKTDDVSVLSSTAQFITAFDSSHEVEAEHLLNTFHKHFPNDKFWVYDLGISESGLSGLKSRDYVVLKQVDFSKFPKYVGAAKIEYRWKPITIASALLETKAIVWADASVVVQSNKLDVLKISESLDFSTSPFTNETKYPVRLLDFTSHTTDPRMYSFFPTNETLLKQSKMFGATIFVLYATKHVKADVLRWLVLCALEPDCLGPEGATIWCSFVPEDRYTKHGKCHRYDQSALNLILFHANNFIVERYIHEPSKDLFLVERG